MPFPAPETDLTADKWACNPDIEKCATDEAVLGFYDPLLPYYLLGILYYVQFLAPVGGYWIQIYSKVDLTGLDATPTNWIEYSALLRWAISWLLFLTPVIAFPLYWLNDDISDFVNAWYIVYVLADAVPAFYMIFFLVDLLIAILGPDGYYDQCDIPSDPSSCPGDLTYIDVDEAWYNWGLWTLFDGLAYFVLIYFGADAVRAILPDGGYELYYLVPNWIYELMVNTGDAPEYQNRLDSVRFT